jgi:hypothetical protein
MKWPTVPMKPISARPAHSVQESSEAQTKGRASEAASVPTQPV